jgi:hypothetical protein
MSVIPLLARERAVRDVQYFQGLACGNNGEDASGDIAVAWSKPDVPVLICADTQGEYRHYLP